MHELKWSASEKKVARRAFDKALERAMAKSIADFEVRAAAVTTADAMWAIGDDLHRQRSEIGEIFDYRYSQLLLVFAVLIRRGYLDEQELSCLSDGKMNEIRYLLSQRE